MGATVLLLLAVDTASLAPTTTATPPDDDPTCGDEEMERHRSYWRLLRTIISLREPVDPGLSGGAMRELRPRRSLRARIIAGLFFSTL